mgnify:CR=1 FL=1
MSQKYRFNNVHIFVIAVLLFSITLINGDSICRTYLKS